MSPPRHARGSAAIRSLKGILSVLFTAYAVVLLIAALPDESMFGSLRPLRNEARGLLDRVKIRSGTEVFAGNRGVWKRKSLCLVVRGVHADGAQSLLYENYRDCQVPDIRLFEDTFYVLLMRAAYAREMKGFLGASGKQRKEEISRLQTNSSFDKVSRYFCTSPLAASDRGRFEPERVDMLWEVKQVHYETKQIRTDLVHAYSFNCDKNRRDTRAYRRFQVSRTPTGSLKLVTRSGP